MKFVYENCAIIVSCVGVPLSRIILDVLHTIAREYTYIGFYSTVSLSLSLSLPRGDEVCIFFCNCRPKFIDEKKMKRHMKRTRRTDAREREGEKEICMQKISLFRLNTFTLYTTQVPLLFYK